MRAAKPVLLVGVTLLGAAGAAWSKGVTVRIDIDGDYLASPIEIADPAVAGRFSIWNGPGVSTSSHGKADPPAWADPARTEGRFVDWPRGWAHDRPAGLQRLEVTFHVGGPGATGEYVFLYEVDAVNRQGYIYLPRWKNELVFHFVEGNWLYASRAWDEAMLPLVARHASPEAPVARRAELGCTIGRAVVTAGGAIESIGRDEHGRERVLNRLQPADPSYSGIRTLIGDVPIGQATDVSCWPARD